MLFPAIWGLDWMAVLQQTEYFAGDYNRPSPWASNICNRCNIMYPFSLKYHIGLSIVADFELNRQCVSKEDYWYPVWSAASKTVIGIPIPRARNAPQLTMGICGEVHVDVPARIRAMNRILLLSFDETSSGAFISLRKQSSTTLQFRRQRLGCSEQGRHSPSCLTNVFFSALRFSGFANSQRS